MWKASEEIESHLKEEEPSHLHFLELDGAEHQQQVSQELERDKHENERRDFQ